jgi:prophage protein
MDIEKRIDEYLKWLKQEIRFSPLSNGYYELVTPFLDSSNDYIQFYVKEENGHLFFTDDSWTLSTLEMSGIKLSDKRMSQIEQIATQFGVRLDKSELTYKTSVKNFALGKMQFTQAMLRIGDMYLTSQSKVQTYFHEDVDDFFREKEIFASKNVSFTGKSSYPHTFDYMWSRTKTHPERVCNVISTPNKANFTSSIFSCSDTIGARRDSQCILIVNDEKKINEEELVAAQNYGIHVIKWSEREDQNNLSMIAS